MKCLKKGAFFILKVTQKCRENKRSYFFEIYKKIVFLCFLLINNLFISTNQKTVPFEFKVGVNVVTVFSIEALTSLKIFTNRFKISSSIAAKSIFFC